MFKPHSQELEMVDMNGIYISNTNPRMMKNTAGDGSTQVTTCFKDYFKNIKNNT